jgi:hypothetical protein
MEEPPRADGRGKNQQPEGLVAAIDAALLIASLPLGDLLRIRFDPPLHHGLDVPPNCKPQLAIISIFGNSYVHCRREQGDLAIGSDFY